MFSPTLFTNRELFDAPVAALGGDYRSIRYDQRGQGESGLGARQPSRNLLGDRGLRRSGGSCDLPLVRFRRLGQVPAERVPDEVADGSVLTPGEPVQRVQGVVVDSDVEPPRPPGLSRQGRPTGASPLQGGGVEAILAQSATGARCARSTTSRPPESRRPQ